MKPDYGIIFRGQVYFAGEEIPDDYKEPEPLKPDALPTELPPLEVKKSKRNDIQR